MTTLVVLVFTQVLVRYLTYQPLAWTEEAARYIFIWLCLLGAAVAARRGQHFVVDLAQRALPADAFRIAAVATKVVEAAFYGLACGGRHQGAGRGPSAAIAEPRHPDEHSVPRHSAGRGAHGCDCDRGAPGPSGSGSKAESAPWPLTLLFMLLLAMVVGIPIAVALGGASALALLFYTDLPITLMVQRIYVGLDSFPLLAAPLFILAGGLMETGGISLRITHLASALDRTCAGRSRNGGRARHHDLLRHLGFLDSGHRRDRFDHDPDDGAAGLFARFRDGGRRRGRRHRHPYSALHSHGDLRLAHEHVRSRAVSRRRFARPVHGRSP